MNREEELQDIIHRAQIEINNIRLKRQEETNEKCIGKFYKELEYEDDSTPCFVYYKVTHTDPEFGHLHGIILTTNDMGGVRLYPNDYMGHLTETNSNIETEEITEEEYKRAVLEAINKIKTICGV